MAYIVPFIVLHVFYIWAFFRDDLSVVDIYWSLGFFTMTLTAFSMLDSPSIYQIILLIMVSLWALRLAGYLAWRLLSHGKEDPRYTEMRKNWGKNIWLTGYLRVYILQFSLMFIISVPLYFYMVPAVETEPSGNHFIGAFLFLYGFIFQAWGDFGLAAFKANPENKGKICSQGAWKYSQHPNYFGEAAMWIAFFIFTMNISPWWTVIGPITIIFFLLKVSGIPMLNMKDKYNSDPKYKDYREKTSLFVPWFPKE